MRCQWEAVMMLSGHDEVVRVEESEQVVVCMRCGKVVDSCGCKEV